MNTVNGVMVAILYGGGLLFIFLAFMRSKKAKSAAEKWSTVAGGILTSEVIIHHSRDSHGRTTINFMPKVTYEYQVDGQKFTGDGIAFGTATYGKKKADAIAAAYPQGTPVTVHYDPANPAKAVLETKSVGGGALVALGIILIALGIMYVIVVMK
jgi:hypothetical protein